MAPLCRRPNGSATVADLAGLEELVLWPKLFRRIVPYLASGFSDFDGFDAWLRADPVNHDDELFLLDKLERGNLHDVVRGIGHQIQLMVWPEDFIISPDPPAGGGGIGPAAAIDLAGWELTDAAGGRQQLGGPLAGGGVVQVTVEGELQLGNQGDTIVLVDPGGGSIDQVTYKANRVRSGRTICFGRESWTVGDQPRSCDGPVWRSPRPLCESAWMTSTSLRADVCAGGGERI